jgi:hypothetical protein
MRFASFFRVVAAVVVAFLSIGSFAQDPVPPAVMPSVELPPELARVLRDYENAWRARDADALASLFTDDGFVLSNSRPAVRGREAIRAAYAESGGHLSLRAFSYSVERSTGFIVGGYAVSADKPDIGKFVLALKRVRGKWMIAADIDNANQKWKAVPAPAPQS